MLKKIWLLTLLTSMNVYAATVDLRILETTDLHSNMLDFDYYKDKPTDRFGFARTATLIQQARQEVKNSVLVDNGDLIQGSPIGDYMAAKGIEKGEVHPVYKALNALNYTVGGLGNHEFNYGLDYLRSALAGAKFPYINSNIYDINTNQPLFTPYLLVDTPVKDREGKIQNIRIAYISFVPPQVMEWDKTHLSGKVIAKDITQTAKELVPQLRQQGADVVIVIAHSGVSSDPYKALAENSVYYLSEIPGIDAIMFGHSHGIFPSKDFSALKGVDLNKGTLNGVAAVMPGQWGDHLGVVDLVLEGQPGQWRVTDSRAEARGIFDLAMQKPRVEPDQNLLTLLAEDHNNARRFTNQPIGNSAINIYGFLALVQDDPSLQLINAAQKDYVEYFIQGDADLANIPVLSAIAPFKAGGRQNDPNGYVEINQGTMSFRNVADLYMYSNTLVTLKVTGKDVREWLECSAGIYNQIDITRSEPQGLINWDLRTYNFDVIDGVNYQIDVTQPPRYNKECQLINPSSHRILDLSYQGKPIDDNAPFLIATNNYRAYSNKFAGTGEDHIAFAAPDEVRSVIINYVSKQTQQQGQINPQVDDNWHIAQISQAKIPLDIRVQNSPSETAAQFIQQYAQFPMHYLGLDSLGFAVYRIDLQSKPKI